MHTNDFVVNDGGAGETVEGVAKLLPHFNGKAATALIVESVDAIDPGTLVVSSKEKKVLRILDLVGKKQTHHFQRLFTAIDVVA